MSSRQETHCLPAICDRAVGHLLCRVGAIGQHLGQPRLVLRSTKAAFDSGAPGVNLHLSVGGTASQLPNR